MIAALEVALANLAFVQVAVQRGASLGPLGEVERFKEWAGAVVEALEVDPEFAPPRPPRITSLPVSRARAAVV